MSSLPYKKAKIYFGQKRDSNKSDKDQPKSRTKDWYVYYSYIDPTTGRFKRFIEKKDINRIKSVSMRFTESAFLRDTINEMLLEGWTPFESVALSNEISHVAFNVAIQFALEKKRNSISSKTYSDYSVTVRYVTTVLPKVRLNHKATYLITRQDVKLILNRIYETHGLSANAYNKHLNHLKSMCTELIEWEVLQNNPCVSIAKMATNEGKGFNRITDEQQIKIKEFLEVRNKNFLTFCISIYHTGCRPKELLALKLKDINLETRNISIIPEGYGMNAKTRTIRQIPINDFLLKALTVHLKDYSNEDLYVFGSHRIPTKGNKYLIDNRTDFIPAPTHIKRDTATKLWNRLIKKELKLDCDMYALKHKGGDDKILAGMDIDTLRELYGHSSKLMTEKYATKVKQVRRKEIMEKSPDF